LAESALIDVPIDVDVITMILFDVPNRHVCTDVLHALKMMPCCGTTKLPQTTKPCI
jgi:hypothetical protein